MRRFFLFLLFILTGYGLQAQSTHYLLTGRVLCAGKPVSGALVETVWDKDTLTDSNGIFHLKLTPGFHTISISKDTCGLLKDIHITKDTSITFSLEYEKKYLMDIVDINMSRQNDPVTITELGRNFIEANDEGKDIPYLLDEIPSAISFSDAGNGVGYTGIRIRGISPQQINVSINGIPLNDPESHSVYWVDIPDILGSTSRIQVQRGIGVSRFGTGAFGANIALSTKGFSHNPGGNLSISGGSFNTQKISGELHTGKLRNGFSFKARASWLHSDGYVDRAFSGMKSYYLAGRYETDKDYLTFIHFGGHERTYQAWYGVDWETFRTHPTFNYAGAIYDNNGNIIRYYDDQVDDYTQNHYQLHYTHYFGLQGKLHLALHYTKGYGYYEQYKQDQKFEKYGMEPLVFGSDTVKRTDLIRRKWLDNDFYGITASMEMPSANPDAHWTLGLAANRYDGRHFGRVIWARFADHTEKDHTYYLNTGIKSEYNGFIRNRYYLTENIPVFSDIQIRHVDYVASYDPSRTYDPGEAFQTSDHLTFINPKIGISYIFHGGRRAYLSAGITHREPNRTDYKENDIKPKPERLYDLETGLKYDFHNGLLMNFTYYYMYYKDQLVYTGKLNNVGYPIRENVGQSYRTGIEATARYQLIKWKWLANLNLSDNRNLHYQTWENNTLKDYGKTRISYSPSLVGYLKSEYLPGKNFSIWASFKYVGKQYMDNRNIPESVLPAYHYTDAGITWQAKNKAGFRKILVGLKIFNIFDQKFAANGYMWGNTAYVFPQAGRHFMITGNIAF